VKHFVPDSWRAALGPQPVLRGDRHRSSALLCGTRRWDPNAILGSTVRPRETMCFERGCAAADGRSAVQVEQGATQNRRAGSSPVRRLGREGSQGVRLRPPDWPLERSSEDRLEERGAQFFERIFPAVSANTSDDGGAGQDQSEIASNRDVRAAHHTMESQFRHCAPAG